MDIIICTIHHPIKTILKGLLFIAKHEEDLFREDFEQHIHKIRSCSHKRPYLNKFLYKELVKVRFSNQEKNYSKKRKRYSICRHLLFHTSSA